MPDPTPVPDRSDDEAVQAIVDLIEPDMVQTVSVEGVHELAEDIIRTVERSRSGPDSAPQGEDHDDGAQKAWDEGRHPFGPGTGQAVTQSRYEAARSPQGEDHETSDAVRSDLHGTSVEWPGRQPTDPDRGQLRDAAIPASGRGRQSADSTTVKNIVEWLRGDEAEAVRTDALARGIPPEDALAHVIEREFGEGR